MSTLERPTGVTIIAVLAGISAGLTGLGACAVITLVPWAGLLFAVVSVLYVAVAYGLWTLAPWGWNLAVGVLVLNLALAAFSLVTGAGVNILRELISVVMLVYLLADGTVRAAFQQA